MRGDARDHCGDKDCSVCYPSKLRNRLQDKLNQILAVCNDDGGVPDERIKEIVKGE